MQVVLSVSTLRSDMVAGKLRRAPGKRNMIYKLADYKKVIVRLADESKIAAGSVDGQSSTAASKELL